jgi:hypothetical protein
LKQFVNDRSFQPLQEIVSVTTILSNHFNPFNKSYVASSILKSKNKTAQYVNCKNENDVFQVWDCMRDKGVAMHAMYEKYANMLEYFRNKNQSSCKEKFREIVHENSFQNHCFFKLCDHFNIFEPNGVTFWRTELSVCDELLHIAGTIDAILRTQHDKYILIDYKRKKKFLKDPLHGKKEIKELSASAKGSGCFSNIRDNDLSHVSLQLCFYKYLFERIFNKQVIQLVCVLIQEETNNFEIINIDENGYTSAVHDFCSLRAYESYQNVLQTEHTHILELLNERITDDDLRLRLLHAPSVKRLKTCGILDNVKKIQSSSKRPRTTNQTETRRIRQVTEEEKKIQEAISLVIKNGLLLAELDDDMKQNELVVLKAVKKTTKALEYAHESFRVDKSRVCKLLDTIPVAYKYISDELRNDVDVFTLAFKRCPENAKYMGLDLKNNPAIASLIIQVNPVYFQFCSTNLKNNKEIAMQALRLNGNMLKYCQDLGTDKNVVLAALTTSSNDVFKYVRLSREDCLEVINVLKGRPDLYFNTLGRFGLRRPNIALSLLTILNPEQLNLRESAERLLQELPLSIDQYYIQENKILNPDFHVGFQRLCVMLYIHGFNAYEFCNVQNIPSEKRKIILQQLEKALLMTSHHPDAENHVSWRTQLYINSLFPENCENGTTFKEMYAKNYCFKSAWRRTAFMRATNTLIKCRKEHLKMHKALLPIQIEQCSADFLLHETDPDDIVCNWKPTMKMMSDRDKELFGKITELHNEMNNNVQITNTFTTISASPQYTKSCLQDIRYIKMRVNDKKRIRHDHFAELVHQTLRTLIYKKHAHLFSSSSTQSIS